MSEITYRWDVMYGESSGERAARLEASPRLRKDGGLDRRYADMRWLERYRANGDQLGPLLSADPTSVCNNLPKF